jgi:hypothetical protein
MAMAESYPLSLLAGIAGAIAGFWLAARTSSTAGSAILYLAGGVLTAWTALLLISAVLLIRLARAQDPAISTVISQDEMIKLIRSHAILAFTRELDFVSIQYASNRPTGNYQWRPDHADPDGFDSYVAAALEIAPDFIVAFHDHDSPGEGLFRWITTHEAVDLLERGMIKTFNYGSVRFPENETASGERTGIKLTDYGWVRHIYVEPSMEGTMVPVARAAQRSHDGIPQFCIDGKYE